MNGVHRFTAAEWKYIAAAVTAYASTARHYTADGAPDIDHDLRHLNIAQRAMDNMREAERVERHLGILPFTRDAPRAVTIRATERAGYGYDLPALRELGLKERLTRQLIERALQEGVIAFEITDFREGMFLEGTGTLKALKETP